MITRPYREEMFYCVAEALTREKEKADTLNDHILKEKVTLKNCPDLKRKYFANIVMDRFCLPIQNDLMKACTDLQENLSKEAERVSSKGDLLRQSKEELGELQVIAFIYRFNVFFRVSIYRNLSWTFLIFFSNHRFLLKVLFLYVRSSFSPIITQ